MCHIKRGGDNVLYKEMNKELEELKYCKICNERVRPIKNAKHIQRPGDDVLCTEHTNYTEKYRRKLLK